MHPPTGIEIALITAAVVGTGVSVASAAGAFDQDAPDIPSVDDPAVEEARQLRLKQLRSQKGFSGTVLTPLTAEAEDPTTRPATLGQVGPGSVLT